MKTVLEIRRRKMPHSNEYIILLLRIAYDGKRRRLERVERPYRVARLDHVERPDRVERLDRVEDLMVSKTSFC